MSINNNVFLSGNVGQDPEVKYMDNGRVVASFSLATKKRWLDKRTNEWKEKTTWHNISCWGEMAKSIEKRVRKGTRMSVSGEVDNDTYTDRNGSKQTRTFIQLEQYEIHDFIKKDQAAD